MNEAGTCPKCGRHCLEYGEQESFPETIHYPYRCKDCGFEGYELYSIEFVEHCDEEGDFCTE